MLLKKIKDHWLVIVVLILANIALFWKFYFKGLLPFPGDLLVSFFFPWNSGGFAGFDQWTTRKEVVAADVVRQMFPWQTFSFDLIKQGQLPLWNPYNFSGTPLLANLQSAVLFIGNLFNLFLPPLTSWIILVIGLLPLFGLFTYFFLRSLKLSRLAAVFGGLVATNLSYLTIWQEQLVITRVALFLPLVLWAINESRFFLVPLFLALAVLAGHAQTYIYVVAIAFAFALFRRTKILTLLFWFVFPALLAAVQLVPTAELYLASAREGEATHLLFAPYILPWQNLLTALAPDFFGNVATNNFWGQNYPDFQVSFGVVALTLAVVGVFKLHQNSLVKFFAFIGLTGILFATSPVAFLLDIFRVPILATGVPARAIFLFQFAGGALAAFGFSWWQSQSRTRWQSLVRPLALVALGYLALWLVVLVGHRPEFLVSRSNLILPTGLFLLTAATLLVSKKLWPLLLFAVMLEATYQFNKYQPFAPTKFVFPSHPILTYLQENADVNRFFGFGTAYLDTNFATYYHLFAADGYDSLYVKRYGELLASTADGSVPKIIPRSTAVFGEADNFYRNRLFDLLGVKYVLDKADNPKSAWEPEEDKFPSDRYQLVWQNSKWKIYHRKSVLPRAFLADSFEIVSNSPAIISRLYSPNFDYRHRVILEKDPIFFPTVGSGSAQIVSYEPNQVTVQTKTEAAKILFLSDTYFPGWFATVDGKNVPIYRADYTFRAVPVPAGDHHVNFYYDPPSFKIGAIISLLSLLGLVGFALWKRRS